MEAKKTAYFKKKQWKVMFIVMMMLFHVNVKQLLHLAKKVFEKIGNRRLVNIVFGPS